MRLATMRDGTRDGRLVVVSADGASAASATGIARTMQDALERWDEVEVPLRALADDPRSFTPITANQLAAPLPRAWQWLDGSAYPSHGVLMQKAFNLPPIETDRPLMYQGMSDTFLGPSDDVPLPSEDDGIDFEGEFGVVVDDVPMGVTTEEAMRHIRLVLQINDWSLRAIAPIEMKTGFGWVQAKPACSAAPFAVTPDELGDWWQHGRVRAVLHITVNGERVGEVEGAAGMAFGFHELVAHAARTRTLVAGTVIGSGTVSTFEHEVQGSSCLSERRAIEMIAGRPLTPFLRFGDRVIMEGRIADAAPFGTIDQRVVSSRQPA